jgi:hypothetical protein
MMRILKKIFFFSKKLIKFLEYISLSSSAFFSSFTLLNLIKRFSEFASERYATSPGAELMIESISKFKEEVLSSLK